MKALYLDNCARPRVIPEIKIFFITGYFENFQNVYIDKSIKHAAVISVVAKIE